MNKMTTKEPFENFRKAVSDLITVCRKQFGELIFDMFLMKHKNFTIIKIQDESMGPFAIEKIIELKFDSREHMAKFNEAMEELPIMGVSLTDVFNIHEKARLDAVQEKFYHRHKGRKL